MMMGGRRPLVPPLVKAMLEHFHHLYGSHSAIGHHRQGERKPLERPLVHCAADAAQHSRDDGGRSQVCGERDRELILYSCEIED